MYSLVFAMCCPVTPWDFANNLPPPDSETKANLFLYNLLFQYDVIIIRKKRTQGQVKKAGFFLASEHFSFLSGFSSASRGFIEMSSSVI